MLGLARRFFKVCFWRPKYEAIELLSCNAAMYTTYQHYFMEKEP